MSDPYFQQLFAERIGGAQYGKGTAIYKFEKFKRAKRQALAEHPERQLLDFGIGENDGIADEGVRRVMAEEVNNPENRGYADNGVAEFKEAVARFMQREYGVALDAATEVNHCIGSKTALSILPATLINPGDITLMTVPGYPVAGTHTAYYGGVVYKLPLLAENNFLPDLQSIPADVLAKAKLLVLCYPNSPTGATATEEFYTEVVQFAQANHLVVVQDAAPCAVVVRPRAQQLFSRARRQRRRRRGAFDVERIRHDRLANGLGLWTRASGECIRRRERQL